MSLSPPRNTATTTSSTTTTTTTIRNASSFTSSTTITTNNSNNNNGGTLYKMIDAAAYNKHHVKWSHVLHYLKAQCVIDKNSSSNSQDDNNEDSNDNNSDSDNNDNSDSNDNDVRRRRSRIGSSSNNSSRRRRQDVSNNNNDDYPFDIPFQRYYIAGPDLYNELAPSSSSSSSQSILRTLIAIISSAENNNNNSSNTKKNIIPPPLSIVQAICYLGPHAISHVDPITNCMILHYICRFPPTSSSSTSSKGRTNNTNNNNSNHHPKGSSSSPSSSSTTTVVATMDMVIDIIIKAYPNALLHRDCNGCTPLHYLFMYYAPYRTMYITQLFLYNFQYNKHLFFTLRQPIIINNDNSNNNSNIISIKQKHSNNNNTNNNEQQEHEQQTVLLYKLQQQYPLPDIPRPTKQNKIPCIAAIIPDSIHGCIPIHYAIMNGASYSIIQLLYNIYPECKHIVDRYNRTLIHYIFGASILNHHTTTCNSSTTNNSNNNNNTNTITVNVPEIPNSSITGEVVPLWNYTPSSTVTAATAVSSSSSSNISLLQQQKLVSNYYYYYNYSNHQNHPNMSMNLYSIVQLLLSSRVARTIDAIYQRNPLHYLCIYIAHQTIYNNNNSDDDDDDDTTTTTQYLISLLQLVIDSYTKQCIGQDIYGMTPIALLLDTIHILQYRIYQEQCYTSNNKNSCSTIIQRQLSYGYTPPIQIIYMLLQIVPRNNTNTTNNNNVDRIDNIDNIVVADDDIYRIVTLEDQYGRLPIHIGLQIAISYKVIALFIHLYPTSCIHTTSQEGWCPLHMTFAACPYIAHLQSIETITILLSSSSSSIQQQQYSRNRKHRHRHKITNTQHHDDTTTTTNATTTYIDGRIAMKMEDSMGYYPIHYVCENYMISSHILNLLVEKYPLCTTLQNTNNDLPIHCIVQHLHPMLLQYIMNILHGNNNTTVDDNNNNNNNSKIADTNHNLEYIKELIIEVRLKITTLLRPLLVYLSKESKKRNKNKSLSLLSLSDSIAGMLPLHIIVLFQSYIDYTTLLTILQYYPYATMQYTENIQRLVVTSSASDDLPKNIDSYSALDLHDICNPMKRTLLSSSFNNDDDNNNNNMSESAWYRIRELLYSFGPTLESHRHRQDLLHHGVQIIIDELLYYEYQQVEAEEENVQDVGKNDSGSNTVLSNQQEDRLVMNPSYHLTAGMTKEYVPPDLEISHSVSAMEEALGMRRARRRRNGSQNRIKVSRSLPSNRSRHQQPSAHRSGSNLNRTITNGPTSGSETLTTIDHNGSHLVQLQLDTNLSIYDDDDVRYSHDNAYDDYDDDDDESYYSEEENDESYTGSDDDEEDETGTDEYDTQDSGTRESLSLEEMSGSRLQVTSYDVEDGNDDDSEVDTAATDDFTVRRGTFDDTDTRTRSICDDDDDEEDEDGSRSLRTRSHDSYSTSKSRRRRTTNLGRRVTFDDESTYRKSFDLDQPDSRFGSFFGYTTSKEQPALRHEEKKDDNDKTQLSPKLPDTPKAGNRMKPVMKYQRPPYMSEVGMRIWTFFVMFCDPNNPKDNYADKLAQIFAAIQFATWEELVASPLPPYAKNYLKNGTDIEGLTFRDIASPKCRAFIHKTNYFLGKYDFSDNHDILVYRTTRDDSVIVKANEWLYITEATTNATKPGISEEQIWSTGEVPAEIGVTFETQQRPVWIKFTKNGIEYDNEIDCRIRLGISVDDDHVNGTGGDIIPILQHFNAISSERKGCKSYSSQNTSDERFRSLNLIKGDTSERKVQILLQEYPYVVVYPAPLRGTLYDYFLKHGISQVGECKQILSQLVHALGLLHQNGICHGNISMRNIVSLDTGSNSLDWGFMDLSSALFLTGSPQYLGGIESNGFALFETETLPPEMFMKVTSDELKQYVAYWMEVEQRFNVSIDKKLISPVVDPKSGTHYVVKCHFIPLTIGANDVALPYRLVPANTSSDFWAIGQLLFVLLSGRNLFHVSARDGRLFDYEGICNWDGCSMIYEYIDDPLIQDILLACLSPYDKRKDLNTTQFLQHPFFLGENLSTKVMETRQNEAALYKRTIMAKLYGESEKVWLDEHSTTIYCWRFDLLTLFHHSPTEIVRQLLLRRTDITIPCSVMILPYNLHDVQTDNSRLAEEVGVQFLKLSKVCKFCANLKHSLNSKKSNNKNGWSMTELNQALGLTSSAFNSIQHDLSELALLHVEEFRLNPIHVAMRLITGQVEKLMSCFHNRNLYLYLVDEYSCKLISVSYEQFPFFNNRQGDEVAKILPLIYLSLLYVRGVTQGLSGFAAMISPDVNNKIPESWIDASNGLSHSLDLHAWKDELILLLQAQQTSSSRICISDSLSVLREYLLQIDPYRAVGGLRRVVTSNTCLWTSEKGVLELEELTQSFNFFDALQNRGN